jgi:hypothetical protein
MALKSCTKERLLAMVKAIFQFEMASGFRLIVFT